MGLQKTIRGLEEQLLDPLVRSSRSQLEELLHKDFVEVGKSGRRWTWEACIVSLIARAQS
jgi:hypothetical protein